MSHEIQMTTRREFLRKGLLFLAAGYSAPFFLTRTVWALDKTAPPTRTLGIPDGRILVVIQLSGGNDGLNTVVPYGHDEYYRARPQLGIPKAKLLKINDTVGLHPNLAKLKELYDRGHVAIVQGVGYPNPDRSHFRSMEIWHTADPQGQTVTYGWLGRYLDNTCPGCDPKSKRLNPLGGINIGGWMPQALKSKRGLSIALDDPDSFRWVPLATDERDAKQTAGTFEKLNTVVASNLNDPHMARLDFLSRVAMNADASSDRLRAVLAKARRNESSYPTTDLARQLQLVARLIAGEIDTRVYYVSMGGFDTHANQAGAHDRLLTELAEAVAAFQADLQKQGNAHRVLTMTFSEFGRRVAENGSAGTDHGTAAPMFICGAAVKGGIYAPHPSLAPGDLDRGDLRFGTDFRQVYATVLENWLGAASAPILGGTFQKLKFV
ncbi:MAG: DUF1501 domain-containing protein [Verrucomicrobiae bacterium]|nr:DUF1501 domain-containing protein [Verrucomicrobiae bacterium]